MIIIAWILLYWLVFIVYGVKGILLLTLSLGIFIVAQVLVLMWFYNKWFSKG